VPQATRVEFPFTAEEVALMGRAHPVGIVLAALLFGILYQGGAELAFDHQSVVDLCEIGYPVAFRTLFKGVCLVPGGSKLVADARNGVSLKRVWSMPQALPFDEWDSYIELQVNAFNDAIRKIDLNGLFLSLTGGLDTRTILAALAVARRMGVVPLGGQWKRRRVSPPPVKWPAQSRLNTSPPLRVQTAAKATGLSTTTASNCWKVCRPSATRHSLNRPPAASVGTTTVTRGEVGNPSF
jgi:hypothetical protein